MNIRLLEQVRTEFNPEQYILDDALRNAVEVAISLDQPLLLTGEPGTGKTRLAYRVAYDLHRAHPQLNFLPQPLVFNTKTTSTARELFYTYDALGHFQAANLRQDNGSPMATTADFIELQALGRAIALTQPEQIDKRLMADADSKQAYSSIVLIDEIDKAPRDFPNDILNEIERFEFEVRELEGYRLRRNPDHRVIVIMTSNSEKNLPEAFLRRCVFYHIPFPDEDQLLNIARSQLGAATPYTDELLKELIAKFAAIRSRAVRKPPATAEMIAWLRILGLHGVIEQDAAGRTDTLRRNLAVLVKTREDLAAVKNLLG